MLLLVPVLIGLFLAVNMGASGTAPSFAAPLGANLIRRESVPGLFGLFVLVGAVVAGHKVVRTLSGEILPASAMQAALVSIILLAVALSLFFANLLRVPQSTSQSTVLALVGSAVYLNNLQTNKLFTWIIPTWFAYPLLAFGITYLFARFFYRPLKKSERINFDQVAVHPIWKYLTIASSCYVAFSIGSNNVANAAGPLSSLMANVFQIPPGDPDFTLIGLAALIVVAPWFGIGSSLMGERVTRTTSQEIVLFGPLGATFISTLTATLLLLASLTRGIPTSLVQLNTACIIAIGMVKAGFKQTATETAVPRLLVVWAAAPVFAFACAYGLTALADSLGWLR
ncbi:MAG: hypothetical protein A3B65_06995 [Acidobacteria bacterium RIFCSPHIGHO2_02_FULL_67_57]|nr:MAG: hypothetical protein A3B65_06995 [Acidobacteria bacterium RIFCSPHIGHO2_02_FULL_67_57]